MTNHMFSLAMVMMSAGVFGGLINYYQMNRSDADPASIKRCLVIGVGSAFLVPVILELVNSDLILEIQGDPSRLLIYTGLCLIAAISSRIFIVNMSDRILQEANLARVQSDSVQHDLRLLQEELLPLIDTETEQDISEESMSSLETEDLDVTSSKVLKTLGCGRFIFRSISGLCREAGTDETTMAKTLGVLVSKDLAGKVSGQKGMRWYLTEKGRRMMDVLV